MSSYRKIIVFIFITLFFSACTNHSNVPALSSNLIKSDFKYKTFANEDRYIMYALEYTKQGDTKKASDLFLKLYENSLNDEYFLEHIKLLFALKEHDKIVSLFEKNRNNLKDKYIDSLKVYILTLSKINDFEKAIINAKELLKKEDLDLNYELIANIYIQKQDYKEAEKVYEKLYQRDINENVLINLSNLKYVYLNKKLEAINLLEGHIKLNGCSNLTCPKLLSFYQEEKNIDGIISVLKKMYKQLEKDSNHFTQDRVYKLLMYYLEKKDIKEAIKFLENSHRDDDKLLNLYRNSGDYEKAYSLAKKLYSEKSNIDYLAQIAMIEFEKAKDKKAVLKSVIKKFEDVLVVLDNHVYQNYLGYILIDYDIDVKRGLMFVNKALEKAPKNLAYIDSLAWGQYKLNNCEEAYKNMKIVVDEAGLEDEEIKTHWKKIKECNK